MLQGIQISTAEIKNPRSMVLRPHIAAHSYGRQSALWKQHGTRTFDDHSGKSYEPLQICWKALSRHTMCRRRQHGERTQEHNWDDVHGGACQSPKTQVTWPMLLDFKFCWGEYI